MNPFAVLAQTAARHSLDFLLIGGHAVNIRGWSRPTIDFDLFVRRAQLPNWKEALTETGFTLFREHENFVQFSPAASAAAGWNLDLMLVNDGTFQKVSSASTEHAYEGTRVRVPSVEHIIALKLHVLRQNLAHRTLKDFQDIVGLVEVNAVDLRSPEMREIFQRYGTEELYRNIRTACGQR